MKFESRDFADVDDLDVLLKKYDKNYNWKPKKCHQWAHKKAIKTYGHLVFHRHKKRKRPVSLAPTTLDCSDSSSEK